MAGRAGAVPTVKGKSVSVAQFLLAQLSGVMLVVAGAAVYWRGKARTEPPRPVVAEEPPTPEPGVWTKACTSSRSGGQRHRRVVTRKPPSKAPHRS